MSARSGAHPRGAEGRHDRRWADPTELGVATERWFPALIAAWRRLARRPGPPEALLPRELGEIAGGVRRLSLGLTRERGLVGEAYMDDPELLGAYLLFYWPVSYAQGRSVLSELERTPTAALDLGAGPGPLTMAALDRGAGEAIAVDRSSRALAAARAVAEAGGRGGLQTRRWEAGRGELPQGPFDLITAGHVLNELWLEDEQPIERRVDLAEELLWLLRPGGALVILEPALRETSRGLLEVRDRLVERGWTIRAPCLAPGACPALDRASDWCHADRPWQPPALVEELADRAKVHKRSLKMSYLVVGARGEGRPASAERSGRFRIVSESLATKGRLRYLGCGPAGRIGLSLPTRHLGQGNEVFAELSRGDVVEVEGHVPKGDGWALGAESRVRLLARADEPL